MKERRSFANEVACAGFDSKKESKKLLNYYKKTIKES